MLQLTQIRILFKVLSDIYIHVMFTIHYLNHIFGISILTMLVT